MAVIVYSTAKKLHVHSIPIMFVTLVLVVATATYFGKNSSTYTSNSLSLNSLFVRTITLTPSSNGLARVSIKLPNIPRLPGADQAGQTTEAYILFSK